MASGHPRPDPGDDLVVDGRAAVGPLPGGRLAGVTGAEDDGRVAGTRHDNGTTAGDEFFAWQYPLHSGKAFGLAGRLLVLGGGVVTLWLCLGGIRLWWRRRR